MKDGPQKYRTWGRGRSVRLPAQWYVAPGTFYFLTVCCDDHQPYFSSTTAATATVETWTEAATRLGLRLWGLCIMPDHLHVLVQVLEGSVSVSEYVKRAKTLTAHRLTGRATLRWQPKFNDHVLRPHEDPMKQLRYLLENPVRKGLVEDWEAWPWKYVDPEALL